MKRIILTGIALFLFNSQTFAKDNFFLKFYAGALLAPSIDSKLTIHNEDTEKVPQQYYTFEDYQGNAGVEGRVSITMSVLEFAGGVMYYSAENKDEDGELSFMTQFLDFGVYLLDKPVKGGLNFSVHFGMGVTQITAKRKRIKSTALDLENYNPPGATSDVDWTKYDDEYAQEMHFSGKVHYDFLEYFGVSGAYINQSNSTATGSGFTNSFFTLSANLKF